MKIKFTTSERLAVLSILPAQGNLATLQQIREAQSALSFSEKEQATLDMTISDNGVTHWNPKKDVAKEVDLSAHVFSLILGELKKLDESNKLQMYHVSIYEKLSKV